MTNPKQRFQPLPPTYQGREWSVQLLKHLSNDEIRRLIRLHGADALGPYIRNDYRTRNLPHTDAVAKGLADDGVLYRPDVPRTPSGEEAYNIQNWARIYLKAHPKLLSKFTEKASTTEDYHDKTVEEAFAVLEEFVGRFAPFVNRQTSDTLHFIVESDIYQGQAFLRADCQLPNVDIWIYQRQYFSERLQRQPKTMNELKPALHEFHYLIGSYNNFCVAPILNNFPPNARAQVQPNARAKLNLFQQKFHRYLDDYKLFVERLVKERPILDGVPSTFNMPKPFV